MWSYEHRIGSHVSLAWNGEVYFRQYFGTQRAARPHAHPVAVAGGPDLTCFAPHDHAWHTGFWFNWKYINGVNYWENTENGTPEGAIRMVGTECLTASADTVAAACDYVYDHPRDGEVARERREITWYRPSADGSHALDYEVRLTANAVAVALDRTPVTPQTPWGGYGGLSWRFSRGLGAASGLDAQGRRGTAIEHQSAPWATLFGRVDGGPGLAAGVAMFDHPGNPRHPTPWRFIAEPGFAYLNPSPLLHGALEVAAGASVRLRYRVLVYPGAGDAERLNAAYEAFASS